MDRGNYTYKEITTQAEAWTQALEVIEKMRADLHGLLSVDYDQVLFTGCGSTYYLAIAAAALFQQETGIVARGVPGSELLLNPETVLPRRKARQVLLVAVSRSGSTTETLRAVEQFKRDQQGRVLAITNYGDQPLAGLADVALVMDKGQEQSMAQTRSFAAMYIAAAAFAALASGDEASRRSMVQLPQVGARLIEKYEEVAREFGENLDFDLYYFLGSGILYGLACEVNLKMKEMALTHSEPFHFLEFRHGPMSMVNERTVMVGLLSEKNFSHEQKVLDEMRAKGGHILSLGETKARVSFESGIPENMRGVLYLPVLQLMGYYRSMAKGLDPDRPKNLTQVIKLDL